MSDHEIERRTLESQPTAVRRFRASAPELGARLGEALPAVAGYLEAVGVATAGPPFTRYLAMDGDVFDVEAGRPTDGPVEGDEETVASELPGGDALSTLHRGPYMALGNAHSALHALAAEQGLSPRAAWESYVDDPSELPPEEVRTVVYLAV